MSLSVAAAAKWHVQADCWMLLTVSSLQRPLLTASLCRSGKTACLLTPSLQSPQNPGIVHLLQLAHLFTLICDVYLAVTSPYLGLPHLKVTVVGNSCGEPRPASVALMQQSLRAQ